MEKYITRLKNLTYDMENNKLVDYQVLDELWDIYSELDKESNFIPKVKKIIKNNDEYFDSIFEKEVKEDIMNIFNDKVTFDKENNYLIISKNDINDNLLEYFNIFLKRIHFYFTEEKNNNLIYRWR
jgi:hypothetical protein